MEDNDLSRMKTESRASGMAADWHYRRGDIYLADLGAPDGSVQGGVRPIIIVQNNTANRHAPTVTYVPLTSRLKKSRQPTHYLLRKTSGLAKPSMVQAEQLGTRNKTCILHYIGRVDARQMRRIDLAIIVHLFLEKYFLTEEDRKEFRVDRTCRVWRKGHRRRSGR